MWINKEKVGNIFGGDKEKDVFGGGYVVGTDSKKVQKPSFEFSS